MNKEQKSATVGENGPTVQWAMEVLIKLGERTGSKRLVPVTSVHIHDWCGQGKDEAWKALGSLTNSSKLTVTVNPILDGFSPSRIAVIENLHPRRCYSFTCAPYLSGNHPGKDDIVAWGGRAASSFANSILGARCEKESFESTVASAITGLTPERGLHLDANRHPTIAITLPPAEKLDYTLLGWEISTLLHEGVPLLCGARPTFDEAKRLALSINARGDLPLFRMHRSRTPPPDLEVIELDLPRMRTADRPSPDVVILGCPHMSEQDINRWSKKLAGHPSGPSEPWFFTSQLCNDKCPTFGAVLRSRGKIFVDVCPLSLKEGLIGRTVATESPSLAECLSDAGISSFYASEGELISFLTKG